MSSVHKIKAILERVLRVMLNESESAYQDLSKKLGKRRINIPKTRTCIETCKSINNLNQDSCKTCSKFVKQIKHKEKKTS